VLTAADKSYTQFLEVKMDPRVKTTPEDLRRQFELDRKIADDLHEDYEALRQIRSLRSQIKWLLRDQHSTSAASNTGLDVAARIAAELEAKAAAIEGGAGGYGARYLTAPGGRSLSHLNSGFSAVLGALDSADDAPTTQQVAMVADLGKALDEQLSAWSQFKSKDIPELNEQLKKAGLPVIDLQKPMPGAEDQAQTTSQDRDQNEE
jgi:hypothetical protein